MSTKVYGLNIIWTRAIYSVQLQPVLMGVLNHQWCVEVCTSERNNNWQMLPTASIEWLKTPHCRHKISFTFVVHELAWIAIRGGTAFGADTHNIHTSFIQLPHCWLSSLSEWGILYCWCLNKIKFMLISPKAYWSIIRWFDPMLTTNLTSSAILSNFLHSIGPLLMFHTMIECVWDRGGQLHSATPVPMHGTGYGQ